MIRSSSKLRFFYGGMCEIVNLGISRVEWTLGLFYLKGQYISFGYINYNVVSTFLLLPSCLVSWLIHWRLRCPPKFQIMISILPLVLVCIADLQHTELNLCTCIKTVFLSYRQFPLARQFSVSRWSRFSGLHLLDNFHSFNYSDNCNHFAK